MAEQGYLAPHDHGAGSSCRSLYALALMFPPKLSSHTWGTGRTTALSQAALALAAGTKEENATKAALLPPTQRQLTVGPVTVSVTAYQVQANSRTHCMYQFK